MFSGKHIVVVGINYAPETTGIAPYTTGLCEYLAHEGAQVTVLAGMPHYPAWTVDPVYRGRLRVEEELNGVSVVRCGHHVPSRQSAARRGLYEATFLLSSSLASRSLRPDAVIAVSPTLSALRTGATLARRNRVPFGAIVQDLMGRAADQSGIPGGGRVAGAVGRAEVSALKDADRVAVISTAFKEVLVAHGVASRRVSVTPNYSHISTTTATRLDARIQLGWDGREFVALHTGNMGLKQDLSNVVRAARALQDQGSTDVRVIFLGDGSQRHALEVEANGLPNVTFLDPVDMHLYPIALAGADVLLVNERSTCMDMSLPSKLTSYLTSGRPVLGAVPSEGMTRKEIARSGGGICVLPGDPDELAAGILRLQGDPGLRQDLGAEGRIYATTHLGLSSAMPKLREFVRDLLDLPPDTVPVGPLAMPSSQGRLSSTEHSVSEGVH